MQLKWFDQVLRPCCEAPAKLVFPVLGTAFFQISEFYWNQTSKPPTSSRTLNNRRLIRFKLPTLEEFPPIRFQIQKSCEEHEEWRFSDKCIAKDTF